jgi:ligand-binding sensor domain-containing protein
VRSVLVACLALFAAVRPAEALRQPIRSYGAAEGLLDAGVDRVRVGPGGFVWIATRGGLWRFDGERFEVLGPADGVPRAEVYDFAFARDGSVWIASESGLFHGDPSKVPSKGPSFSEVRLEDAVGRELPHRVAPAPDGTVWVGTFTGLWRIRVEGATTRAERRTPPPSNPLWPFSRVQSLSVDSSGSVWVGTHADGVYRLRTDGTVDHVADAVWGCNFVRDFLFDDRGGVFTAFLGGIARFDVATFGSGAGPDVLLESKEGLPGIDTQSLLSIDPGRILLASNGGITEIVRDGTGRYVVGATLDRRSGLPADDVASLDRDGAGNLWIGFVRQGLAKRIAGGLLIQDDVEEPGMTIAALGRDRAGRLAVLSHGGSRTWTIHVLSHDRIETHRLALPKPFFYVGWGLQQLLAEETDGTWWVVSGAGALRYGGSKDGLSRLERSPDEIVGRERGLPNSDVYALYLDRGGDVWISAVSMVPGISSVARIRRRGLGVETFSTEEVGPPQLAVGFAEDPRGGLWIAFEDGTIVRRFADRFLRIPCALGPLGPAPFVPDSRGRLWIVGAGLAVVERPDDPHPVAKLRALPSDLAGVTFDCGVDDGTGTLYLGTQRGVVRLDPASGRMRWLTAADGLVGGVIRLAARDADGVLWFSDESGLSRLTPAPDPPAAAHVPGIRGVRVAGVPIPVPATGARSVGPLVLDPSQHTVAIDFFAVHHGPGEAPAFQYRLEGADSRWSERGKDRSVLYAGLAPGRYRFAVRTVEPDGTAPSDPAVVDFRVLAPVWLRGWFVALLVAAVASIAYGVHRLRIGSAVAVERVRTRIATDLHDEIGSSLSQISVLSQLAERDPAGESQRALSRIRELARGVVESMGETVWAISPREDNLQDLVGRMRRFGLELFADGVPSIRLELPVGEPDERVDADVRRTLYIVFKEALHNGRKHAGAKEVAVSLRRDRGGFELRVADDGRGFDPSSRARGHGLDGMRRRAEAIGGSLDVRSVAGGGSEVVLRAPARKTNLFRRIVGRSDGGT